MGKWAIISESNVVSIPKRGCVSRAATQCPSALVDQSGFGWRRQLPEMLPQAGECPDEHRRLVRT